jgi:hypothetical protein
MMKINASKLTFAQMWQRVNGVAMCEHNIDWTDPERDGGLAQVGGHTWARLFAKCWVVTENGQPLP